MSVSDIELEKLSATLLNAAGNVPLAKRFRALFTLKTLAVKNDEALRIITKGFSGDSALLKHELAYCLGQTKKTAALPTLVQVLQDEKEDPMVRHEAAEAMGAISSKDSIPILRQYLHDSNRSVRETCEIALAKIEWDHSEEGRHEIGASTDKLNPVYTSVDPAPPSSSSLLRQPSASSSSSGSSIEDLRTSLLNTSLPLFQRYRAMFALRNIGTEAAVNALADGFSDDSALFKHEIAFVFGQLLSIHSVPALLQVLGDDNQSDMVRHEAAEALGGIGAPDLKPILEEWAKRQDAPQVIRESCEVALDMWEHENSGAFQYADGLEDARAPAVVAATA